MRIRLIFAILIIPLLLYTGCAAVKKQSNAEEQLQEQLHIKTLSGETENPDTPEPPKLLGGWEDISPDDHDALFYYSEAIKEIDKSEDLPSDLKLRRIRRQVVAGIKYHYFAETVADGEGTMAEIIILVHFDKSFEIIEYNVEPGSR